MAEPIQEYLISIRYAIDAASQQQFLGALKNVTASTTGVKRSILDLMQALLEMTEQLARAGEKLYWASQRMGSSVSDLQRTAAAMSNLGVSAETAMASMESFGAWTRNMGPAGIAYLQRLGITATDTAGRMRQLGQFLRNQGFMPGQEGTAGYARGLAYLRQFGLSEDMGRALSSGQAGAEDARYGLIQRLIWGKDAQTGPQKFADQSVVIMNKFRELGFIFEGMRQKFGLMLFEKMGPLLDRIGAALIKAQPAFEQGVKYLGLFIELIDRTIENLEKMPPAFGRFITAMVALPGLISLVKSPIFWLITALTTLMLLIDDYMTWKEGGESQFDWSAMDGMFQGIGNALEPILKVKEAIDQWFFALTGVCGVTDYLLGAAIMGGWLLMASRIGGITTAAAAAARAIGGITLASSLAIAAWLAVLALKGDTAPLSPEDQKKLDERNAEELRKYRQAHPDSTATTPEGMQEEINKKHGYTGNVLHDTWQMIKNGLGFGGGGGAAPEKRSDIGTDFKLASADSSFMPSFTGTGNFQSGGQFGNFLANYVMGQGGENNSPYGGGDAGMIRNPGGGAGGGGAGAAAGAAALRDMIAAKLGISKEAASGIVSNMQAESGLRADINERNPTVKGSRGGYGLVQWTGPRRIMLEKWAAERGLDVTQHATQVAFMEWELDKYYPNWRKTMGGAGSPTEFAERFNRMYVRAPGAAQAHRAPAQSIFDAPSSMRPMMAANDAGGKYGVTNSTTINLTAPDPATGANKVAYEQSRIHEQQSRRAAPMRSR